MFGSWKRNELRRDALWKAFRKKGWKARCLAVSISLDLMYLFIVKKLLAVCISPIMTNRQLNLRYLFTKQTSFVFLGCVGKKNLANLEARQLVSAIQCVFKKPGMWSQSRVSLEPLMIAMVKRCSGQNHWLEQQLSAILLELLQVDFNRKFQR